VAIEMIPFASSPGATSGVTVTSSAYLRQSASVIYYESNHISSNTFCKDDSHGND
jgi:hypothetical protein